MSDITKSKLKVGGWVSLGSTFATVAAFITFGTQLGFVREKDVADEFKAVRAELALAVKDVAVARAQVELLRIVLDSRE